VPNSVLIKLNGKITSRHSSYTAVSDVDFNTSFRLSARPIQVHALCHSSGFNHCSFTDKKNVLETSTHNGEYLPKRADRGGKINKILITGGRNYICARMIKIVPDIKNIYLA